MHIQRTHEKVALAGGAGLASTSSSVTLDHDVLVLSAPTYCDEPVRIPIADIAAVVDLRERRARRLPSPVAFGHTMRVAGVDTATVRSPLDRATLGLVFRVPIALPAAEWDGAATEPGTGDQPSTFDAVAVNAGRQTDHLLAMFSRRGVRPSATLASAVLAAAEAAQPRRRASRTGSLGPRGSIEEQLVVASLCLVVATVVALGLVLATGSPAWLLLLVVAVPIYLVIASRSSGPTGPPRTRRR